MRADWADTLDGVIAFSLVLLVAWLANGLCSQLLTRVVVRLVSKTKATWDDIVFDQSVLRHLSRMVGPLIIYLAVPTVFAEVNSLTLVLIQRACQIWVLLSFLLFINAFLKAVYSVYSVKERLRDRPLKGLLQTVQVMLWCIGAIIIVSILIDRDPVTLLAGLGASAAVLMLVFKDTIMGLVSGVQLSANDMLKVGDWIQMPKHGADGTVIEVTLNTVKVRNWDNTIVTVPPYLLVSDSFQNWRGMRESGGRRIKRSISIDASTVCFCTPERVERYRKLPLAATVIDRMQKNGTQLTNIGILRAYLLAYLESLPAVNREMMCMVRQLQPTNYGIPLELYFFSADKNWVAYETLQADVFDHVYAVIPEFDLRLFQSPTGHISFTS